ncbi:MAG: serine hydrolase [Bacteroidetes bacterium]|jgi:beta-lactamase class A|nr:serine hydrolase [Bacteroidota bacterium]
MLAFLISLLLIFPSVQQTPTETDSLKKEVESYLTQQEGTFAVWFQHLQNNELHFSIHADTVFHAASTMKTPVMIELFRQAEMGRFSLDDSIRIENRFYSIVDSSEFQLELDPDSDDPFESQVGKMTTLRDLNHAMITFSSNISTNILIQLAGAENVTETMEHLGAESMEVLRGVYDMKAYNRGLSNTTTAKDLGIIFEKLARGEVVSPEADSSMVEVLKDQQYRDIIPAGLPESAAVANKTGWITGVRHDSAIVELTDGQSYILIFLSKNLTDAKNGAVIGKNVSEMIYNFLAGNH